MRSSAPESYAGIIKVNGIRFVPRVALEKPEKISEKSRL
jgi:hypothetical protein